MTPMTDASFVVKRLEGVAVVRLDRPPVNALDLAFENGGDPLARDWLCPETVEAAAGALAARRAETPSMRKSSGPAHGCPDPER